MADMSVMEAEVFDAFRSIGVPAMAAAQMLSRRDADIVSLKADMGLLKWMVGAVMALNIAILLKLFLH